MQKTRKTLPLTHARFGKTLPLFTSFVFIASRLRLSPEPVHKVVDYLWAILLKGVMTGLELIG